MKLKTTLWFIVPMFFISCESDKEKFARAERECAEKNSIEKLEVSLYGYSVKDASLVSIKIKRSGELIEDYQDTISTKFSDSSRLRRDYTIRKNILLTDTVMVTIANEPARKIYGFSYAVNPHFTMMDSNFGCEFSSFIMDGEMLNESTVSLIKRSAK